MIMKNSPTKMLIRLGKMMTKSPKMIAKIPVSCHGFIFPVR